MAGGVARPEDLLLAYDQSIISVSDQAAPLEVRSVSPFGELTGGSDTHYDDFTSGLRDFVTARKALESAGGNESVWFEGGGADPSAVVAGVDWLIENAGDPDAASGDADGNNQLLDHVVDKSGGSLPESDEDIPKLQGLLSHVVDAPQSRPDLRRDKSTDSGLLAHVVDTPKQADSASESLEDGFVMVDNPAAEKSEARN